MNSFRGRRPAGSSQGKQKWGWRQGQCHESTEKSGFCGVCPRKYVPKNIPNPIDVRLGTGFRNFAASTLLKSSVSTFRSTALTRTSGDSTKGPFFKGLAFRPANHAVRGARKLSAGHKHRPRGDEQCPIFQQRQKATSADCA